MTKYDICHGMTANDKIWQSLYLPIKSIKEEKIDTCLDYYKKLNDMRLLVEKTSTNKEN